MSEAENIKKGNDINQFIAFLKIIQPGTRMGPKIMSVEFLCYFNKMYFYYTLEMF